MELNFDTAKAIVEAAHAAWNNRNIEGVLDHYTDDLIYWSNAGGHYGGPLSVAGKTGLRNLLTPVLSVIDSMTTIETFAFADGVARTQVSTFVRHKATGLDLSGYYRQLLYFRGFSIFKNEEFHDAAMLSAFWRLVRLESEVKPRDGRTGENS